MVHLRCDEPDYCGGLSDSAARIHSATTLMANCRSQPWVTSAILSLYNIDRMGNRTSVVDNNLTEHLRRPTRSTNITRTGGGRSTRTRTRNQCLQWRYVRLHQRRAFRVCPRPGNTTYSMVYDALGRSMNGAQRRPDDLLRIRWGETDTGVWRQRAQPASTSIGRD